MSFSVVIIGGDRVLSKFDRMRSGIEPQLVQRMNRITIRLQSHIVRDKLSGQVLHFRTNNLRGSIHPAVTNENGAVVGTVGTNVVYAAVHEYGFNGTETVKEHLRTIRQAFGRPLKSPRQVTVRQHSRTVSFPVRSFLRSAMEDMHNEIIDELAASVKDVIE